MDYWRQWRDLTGNSQFSKGTAMVAEIWNPHPCTYGDQNNVHPGLDSKAVSTMKPIESQFKSDGFDFKMLKRQGLVAMFSKSKHGQESFEVVVLQIHKACKLTGRDGVVREYPDREAMPASEQWGQQGWTYTDLEAANKRYYALQNQS